EILDALSPDQYTTEMIPHVYMGPLPTMIYPAFQLIDYSVHTWDMRAGLGELKPLSEDAANTLIPYMFIVLQVTVDEEAAKGFDANWGVRISGDAGGTWKLALKDGKLTYEEGIISGLPVVFNFDANDWVLTAYQRFPGGAVIGDRQLAYRIRRLFFRIENGRRDDGDCQGRLPGEAGGAEAGVSQTKIEATGDQRARAAPSGADLFRHRAHDQVLQRGARIPARGAVRESGPEEFDPLLP